MRLNCFFITGNISKEVEQWNSLTLLTYKYLGTMFETIMNIVIPTLNENLE